MTPEAAAKFKMFEVSRRLGARAFFVRRISGLAAWHRFCGAYARVFHAHVCGPKLSRAAGCILDTHDGRPSGACDLSGSESNTPDNALQQLGPVYPTRVDDA